MTIRYKFYRNGMNKLLQELEIIEDDPEKVMRHFDAMKKLWGANEGVVAEEITKAVKIREENKRKGIGKVGRPRKVEG